MQADYDDSKKKLLMEKCFWLVQGVNAYKEIISLKAQIKKQYENHN